MSTLRLLNKLIKPFRYEISRIDEFEKAIRKTLRKQEQFYFVQVGANDGVHFDNLFALVSNDKCRGLVVEPLEYYFEKLERHYAGFPNIQPIRCAIHESESTAVVYHIDPDSLDSFPPWFAGLGSFDREHLIRAGVAPEQIAAEQVDCMPLTRLIEDYRLPRVDLLQIDTEGYDAEIVKSIDFQQYPPRIIKYEQTHLSPADVQDTRRLLRDNGYRVLTQGNDCVALRLE
ncbi:FkbM family methyltransferase [Salinisphaera hydrothermalis]|uniref:FkbM family methyltransferase n=1 Tax=Salinisphaera hydrothermalis TaxID=563188 RepID=UPI00056BDCEF|nr:FkbM family methyltransferase [Salinisphaera hydrothermalis]